MSTQLHVSMKPNETNFLPLIQTKLNLFNLVLKAWGASYQVAILGDMALALNTTVRNHGAFFEQDIFLLLT